MKISYKSVLWACVLSLTCGLSSVFAETVTWIGDTDTNWGTAANWSTGKVPANGDTINLNDGALVDTNWLALGKDTVLNINGTAKLNHNGSDFNVQGATVNQYGGTLKSRPASGGIWFNIGENWTTGNYNLYGGTIDALNFYAGRYGPGNIVVDGPTATITASNFYVGFGPSMSGDTTFNFKNGSITASSDFKIGGGAVDKNGNKFGTTTFTMTGGTLTNNCQASVGVYSESTNTNVANPKAVMLVSGGTWKQNGKFILGDKDISDTKHSQTASLTINGTAEVTFAQDVVIGNGNGTGDGSNMVATLTLAGGKTTFTNTNHIIYVGGYSKTNTAKFLISGGENTISKALYVMGKGSAELSISGGTNTFNKNVIYGNEAGNKGSGEISGGTNTFANVYIGNGAGATVNVKISGGNNTFNNGIVVGNKKESTSVLEIVGGTNEFKNAINISGKGAELKITGGTSNTFTKDVNIGDGAAGGTLTTSGGTTTFNLAGQCIFVGKNGGTGTWNISDSADVTFTGNDIHVGNGTGSKGTVNQTGGKLTVKSWFNVGEYGTGEYNLSGGTLDLTSATIWIARRGTGSLTVSDSGILKGKVLNIAYNSSIVEKGDFIVKGGEATLTGINIGTLNEGGDKPSGTFTVTVQDTGKLTVNGGINIGSSGDKTGTAYHTIGVMNLKGGTTKVTGNIQVGDGVRASGEFNISGGTNTLTDVYVAHKATVKSEMNVSGGETTIKGLYVASANGSTGTVNLKGGTFTTTGDVALGRAAGSTATMNISGGTNTLYATYVGIMGGTNSLLNVTGGTTSTQNLFIAKEGNSSGKVTISGGKFTSASSTSGDYGMIVVGSYNGNDTTSTGTLEISGKDTVVESRLLRAGTRSTGNTIKITGGTYTLKAIDSSRNWIGANQGAASLEITGGTLKASYADFVVGFACTGEGYGVMTVSGNGTFNQRGTGNFIIHSSSGNNGKGTVLNLSENGTIDVLWFSLCQHFGGGGANATAEFNMTGGTLKIGEEFRMGHNTKATVNISGGSVTAKDITLDKSGQGSVLNLTGSEATIKGTTLTFNPTGTLNVTAGTMLDEDGNTQAPFSTFEISGTADVKSTINIDMSAYKTEGMTFGDPISVALFKAGTLNYNPKSVTVEGPWIISTEGNQMTLKLDTTDASHVEVKPGDTYALDNLGQSGWIDVTGTPQSTYDLSIYYRGVDDEAKFEEWVSENLFGNQPDAEVKAENNVLTVSGLKLGSLGENQIYYDLSKYGEGKAVFGAEPNHVPEPATWGLLVLGLIGLYRIRRI